MKLCYDHLGQAWEADFTKPMDLSIPLSPQGPRAWYVDAPTFSPVMENGFIGSVAKGGKVNFFNVFFNPHGHGTHTETYGHIDLNQFPISEWKGPYCGHALLLTVTPEKMEDDHVIRWSQIQQALENHRPEALIIRTLPNEDEKKLRNYSSSNFPYLESQVGVELNRLGVKHLLVDLPSVDREEDEGRLACHYAFWGYPENPRKEATISEMIFVKNEISDGVYCLYLQPPSFAMDAAPSRPIIYPTHRQV
ncbi:MAG: hypothetical protein RLY35_1826 [Bacteroidota bacterium]|jgi:kynurenine formamidase